VVGHPGARLGRHQRQELGARGLRRLGHQGGTPAACLAALDGRCGSDVGGVGGAGDAAFDWFDCNC
jgi:hypothetical protein